jgi:hypothetical protein
VLLAATVACGSADASVLAAGAPTGRPSLAADAPNTCPQDLDRWGQLRGSEPDSSGGTYRQSGNGTINPSFYLPQQVVSGGQQWQFAYDTTVEAGSGRAQVRIEVDWYSTPGGDSSSFIGHVDGPWINVPVGSTNVTTIRHSFTAPEGAVRANVLTDMRAGDPDNTWTGRNCDYRRIDGQSSTTAALPRPAPEPTTTTVTTAAPRPAGLSAPSAPSAGADTAASRHRWGEQGAAGCAGGFRRCGAGYHSPLSSPP